MTTKTTRPSSRRRLRVGVKMVGRSERTGVVLWCYAWSHRYACGVVATSVRVLCRRVVAAASVRCVRRRACIADERAVLWSRACGATRDECWSERSWYLRLILSFFDTLISNPNLYLHQPSNIPTLAFSPTNTPMIEFNLKYV